MILPYEDDNDVFQPQIIRYADTCHYHHQYHHYCITAGPSSSPFPLPYNNIILHQPNFFRENLVFLQVGFAEIAYEVYEQTPAYGPSSFFGVYRPTNKSSLTQQ